MIPNNQSKKSEQSNQTTLKYPPKSPDIWASFVRKIVTKNLKESPIWSHWVPNRKHNRLKSGLFDNNFMLSCLSRHLNLNSNFLVEIIQFVFLTKPNEGSNAQK